MRKRAKFPLICFKAVLNIFHEREENRIYYACLFGYYPDLITNLRSSCLLGCIVHVIFILTIKIRFKRDPKKTAVYSIFHGMRAFRIRAFLHYLFQGQLRDHKYALYVFFHWRQRKTMPFTSAAFELIPFLSV